MRILFLISEFFYYERLGFLYAATPVKANGHLVKVLQPQSLFFNELSEKISKYNPDMIGYTVSTGEHNFFLKLNRKLKQKHNFFSIFGGPHPTFFKEMIHEDGVDAVCIGEAEDALLEFITKFESKEDFCQITFLLAQKK